MGPQLGAAGQVLTLDGRRRLVLGGVEAFLGENCPNPRDLSATSPAPEAFLAVPQHVITRARRVGAEKSSREVPTQTRLLMETEGSVAPRRLGAAARRYHP